MCSEGSTSTSTRVGTAPADHGEADEAEEAEPAPTKRQRMNTASGESQKLRNFRETLRVAASAIRQVRQRIDDVKHGRLPLRPISTAADGQQTLGSASKKFAMSKECLPRMQNATGALVFIVARDLVSHSFSNSDQQQLQQLVDCYDELDVAPDATQDERNDAVDERIVSSTIALISELTDKDTRDKIVFSTIHRFKGKQRRCAFVTSLSKPFAVLTLANRAALGHTHEPGCLNIDGGDTCACGGFLAGMERIKTAMISEKQRLYYVATSRAEERLFLCFSEDFHTMDAVCPRARCTSGVWGECV